MKKKTYQSLQQELDSLRRQLCQTEIDRTAEAALDKKSCGHFQFRRGTATNLTLTHQFIQAEEANFPVRLNSFWITRYLLNRGR